MMICLNTGGASFRDPRVMSRPVRKVLRQLDKYEYTRGFKNREKIRQYQRREAIESILSRWWRKMAIMYGVWIYSNAVETIEPDFNKESEKRIKACLEKYGLEELMYVFIFVGTRCSTSG